MPDREPGREYLIIPNADELAAAWAEYRALTQRRAQRGDVSVDESGRAQVSGFANADQILAAHPHLLEQATELGEMTAANVSAGRIDAGGVFLLGVKHILEMLAITTTAHQIAEMTDDIE